MYLNIFLPENLESFLKKLDAYNMNVYFINFFSKGKDKYRSERNLPRYFG